MSAQEGSSNNSVSHTWVITPTRALSWPQAKRVLWLISLFPAGGGILFLCYGLPLVLPFAGVEIAMLWLAFYTVISAGQWREIVRVDGAQVTVEKGRIGPLQVYSFDRAWVRVELRGAPFRWYPNRLCLTSHGREVVLAQFLTDGERIELAQSLINAIHKTR